MCTIWDANSNTGLGQGTVRDFFGHILQRKIEGFGCLLCLWLWNHISYIIFNCRDNCELCFWRRNFKGFGRTNVGRILLNWHPIKFCSWNLRLSLNNLLFINYVFLPGVQSTTISSILTKVLTMGAKIQKPFIGHLHTKRENFPLDHNLMDQLLRKIHVD